jgi:hypothetical protein
LRRFDRWLEQTLKSNKDIAAGMHLWREVVRTTTVRFHDLRSRVQRFTRAPED